MDEPLPPFKGVEPYEVEDYGRFDGRDEEKSAIIAKLFASPLTVVYGASGVGKTSLLRACIIPELEEEYDAAIIMFRDWQPAHYQRLLNEEIFSALLRAINKKLRRHESEEISPEGLEELLQENAPHFETDANGVPSAAREAKGLIPWRNLPLHQLLATGCDLLDGNVFLILDQLEEYFFNHSGDTFDQTLAIAINTRRQQRIGFLFSLRDDGLSKIDRLYARVPNLLSNLLRIRHLSHEGAKKSIKLSQTDYNSRVERFNKEHPDQPLPSLEVEEDLVVRLIDDLRPDRVGANQDTENAGEAALPAIEKDRVSAAHLQMVLSQLWSDSDRNIASSASSRRITLDRYRILNGANGIIQSFVAEKLKSGLHELVAQKLKPQSTPAGNNSGDFAEQVESKAEALRKRASLLFKYMISELGTKLSRQVRRLQSSAKIPADQITEVMGYLEELRLVRSYDPQGSASAETRRYEIGHDLLATAIRDWREKFEAELEKQDALRVAELERQEALRKAELEKQIALEKAVEEERRRASERALEERRIANEQALEEKRKADELALEEKRKADEQALEEKRKADNWFLAKMIVGGILCVLVLAGALVKAVQAKEVAEQERKKVEEQREIAKAKTIVAEEANRRSEVLTGMLKAARLGSDALDTIERSGDPRYALILGYRSVELAVSTSRKSASNSAKEAEVLIPIPAIVAIRRVTHQLQIDNLSAGVKEARLLSYLPTFTIPVPNDANQSYRNITLHVSANGEQLQPKLWDWSGLLYRDLPPIPIEDADVPKKGRRTGITQMASSLNGDKFGVATESGRIWVWNLGADQNQTGDASLIEERADDSGKNLQATLGVNGDSDGGRRLIKLHASLDKATMPSDSTVSTSQKEPSWYSLDVIFDNWLQNGAPCIRALARNENEQPPPYAESNFDEWATEKIAKLYEIQKFVESDATTLGEVLKQSFSTNVDQKNRVFVLRYGRYLSRLWAAKKKAASGATEEDLLKIFRSAADEETGLLGEVNEYFHGALKNQPRLDPEAVAADEFKIAKLQLVVDRWNKSERQPKDNSFALGEIKKITGSGVISSNVKAFAYGIESAVQARILQLQAESSGGNKTP